MVDRIVKDRSVEMKTAIVERDYQKFIDEVRHGDIVKVLAKANIPKAEITKFFASQWMNLHRQILMDGEPFVAASGSVPEPSDPMVIGSFVQHDTGSTLSKNDERMLQQELELFFVPAAARPTAVNLFWALERMRQAGAARRGEKPPGAILEDLLAEARAIHDEDRQMCRAIGRHGAELLGDGQGILTHCNAGGLATADYGTALAVIFAAAESGKRLHVFADETRPLLQGARLTAWELLQDGLPVVLITDNMAGWMMAQGQVNAVVVGADRIVANGDVANKVGTYSVAVLAKEHGIPFYVAAPTSTFDLALADGSAIPIEERSSEEVTHVAGRRVAPEGVRVRNPAFDVTPARFVTAIVCERGVARAPYDRSLRALV